MAQLTLPALRLARLRSHLLIEDPETPAAVTSDSVEQVAEWFGAMQAQDLASGLWSFAARLPGAGRSDIERAVAEGRVLRTWALRGTIHFVAARDARWLLQTAGQRALRVAGARWRSLALDEQTGDRITQLWGSALTGGRRLTRAQMLALAEDAGVDTSGQRGYHLLWYSALRGVLCIGPNEGGEQTFALLEEWAPRQRDLSGEAALAELALRYFRSHGPATRRDFAGWSGITGSAAAAGIAAAGGSLVEVPGEVPQYADPAVLDTSAPADPVVHLLPGFDEYVLGVKDRSGIVPHGGMERLVPGGNGIFRPTILVDGLIRGTWRMRPDRKGVPLEWFTEPGHHEARGAHRAAQRYLDYLAG